VADDEVFDDIKGQAEDLIAQLGGQIEVPTGVSEDEAVRAVQRQFRRAGFVCPDDEARWIVRRVCD
jgi:hypothetical protein